MDGDRNVTRGRGGVGIAPIDPWRLKQFVLTVDAPTLTVAASALYVTPQALSSSLRRLERDLGVDLFLRDSRSLKLTSAGKMLYNGARAVLTGNELLARQVRRVAAGTSPVLCVGYTPAVLAYEVYQLLAPLMRRQCGLRIHARSVDSSGMLKPLVSGDVNIVFRRGAQTISGFETELLGYERLNLAVSKDSALASMSSVGLKEICARKILVPAPEHVSAFTDAIIAKCHSQGYTPALVTNPINGLPIYTAAIGDPDVCAFTTAVPGKLCGGEVRVIEIEDEILTPMQMIWLPGTIPDIRGMLKPDYLLPADGLDS